MAEIELIDSNEICERLGISKTRLTQLKQDSKSGIPKPFMHQNGNTCYWKKKSMLDWIAKQPKGPKKGLDNQMALNFLKKLYG